LKNNLISYLFFLTGIINIIASVVSFGTNQAAWGSIHLVLGITFIALGLNYKNRNN
jgi:uncharacterized membrane protein HdeD (DUF308 family)